MDTLTERAMEFVRQVHGGDSSGHDFFHTVRVWKTAMRLADAEGADPETVSLAALLHDADDRKLSPETCEGLDNAVRFMREQHIPREKADLICRIIRQVSFAGTDSVQPDTPEGRCVQDADRLDAMGAIGAARAFAYGGAHGRVMHDPDIAPEYGMTGEQYARHISTTVNHFYEKLFTLSGSMNTAAAKQLALQREEYMRGFIDEFLQEWEGER